ncbi:MAG: DUF2304 domain-containing protein [Lachnospiraceae bacterium]|nr:DUF2304 domain-containing protein [Lachnospiraceae bacterium]
MTLKIQIIIAIIILFGILIILNYIKKNRLELKYALSWLGVGIFVLILDCVPNSMTWLSDIMGIASPVNMIFFLGFCFSLIIMFTLTVALSITSSTAKRLTQKVALLEKRIANLEGLAGKEKEE